jgi:D-glycero-beta-D-manno-heptose 1-phosphate adenylyltransferase
MGNHIIVAEKRESKQSPVNHEQSDLRILDVFEQHGLENCLCISGISLRPATGNDHIAMQTIKETIAHKIFGSRHVPAFQKRMNTMRTANKRCVFTNGCFDILHLGHIDYLARAADLGDCLIIGLNTDSSVARLKGPGRPVNNEMARAHLLAALFFVDTVVLFDEDTPYELINTVQPEVLVKGGDYKPDEIVGSDIVRANNGKVIVIDIVEGYSTSALIQKLTV